MDGWLILIAAVSLPLIGAFFIVAWASAYSGERRAVAEARRRGVPYYVESGGAYLGETHFSRGFAIIVATSEAIAVSALRHHYTLERSSILRLSLVHAFLTTGLRIHHNLPTAPHYIVLWTLSISRLSSELERLGWRIQE